MEMDIWNGDIESDSLKITERNHLFYGSALFYWIFTHIKIASTSFRKVGGSCPVQALLYPQLARFQLQPKYSIHP
jgi:hypothetical protein